jgi:hypothetical protein
MNNQIEDYNNELIKNNTNIDIINYIKYIAINIYKTDIIFMDELLELITKNNISIHHNYLITFGVIKLTGGTTYLKDIIKSNNFIENKDFRLTDICESVSTHSGCTHKKNIVSI